MADGGDAPVLVIVSGPAGSGKSTLCDQLVEEFPLLRRVVTTTTRPPRDGEVSGVHYHFVSKQTFHQMMKEGRFFEWAVVHGNYYGTEKEPILKSLDEGHDLLLNIDVQGAASFRMAGLKSEELGNRMVSVFIKPESLEVIRERLEGRGDEPASIERRLQTAEEELLYADTFNHVILTTDRESDYEAIREIYIRHKEKP